MIYKYKKNRGFSVPASVVGIEINKIESKIKRRILSNDLLKAAKKETNPLHDCFTWDNTEASKKWRVHEARLLLNSIEVVIEDINNNQPISAFVHVRDDIGDGYTHITHIINNEDNLQSVLRECYVQLKTWQNKYQVYKELQDITIRIDPILEEIKNNV